MDGRHGGGRSFNLIAAVSTSALLQPNFHAPTESRFVAQASPTARAGLSTLSTMQAPVKSSRWLLLGASVLAVLGSTGCSTVGYYWQAASGHMALMRAREPIGKVIADPATPEKLRDELEQARVARDWAVKHLELPDNGSYRSYADVKRDALLWNVFAAPEFSLKPKQWCHPFVGCMSYQGWFNEAKAHAVADELRQQGWETTVGGVTAYSTLGWFDDPIINTMLRRGTVGMIGTIFHELAHQKLYIKNDTAFNESYANFVEEQGLTEFLASHGLDAPNLAMRRKRQDQFTRLILDTRSELGRLYAEKIPADQMRSRKAHIFEELRQRYEVLRDQQWGGYKGYDGWFEEPLNNARLLPFGLYDGWVPAFSRLYQQEGQQWSRFHAQARRIGKLPEAQRHAALEALMAAPADPSPRVSPSPSA